jgi:hypothetical protein
MMIILNPKNCGICSFHKNNKCPSPNYETTSEGLYCPEFLDINVGN